MNTPIESTRIADAGNGENPGRSSAVTAAARTRRKLVAGGMAAPLLMTVAGRPVWAGGTMCSPSALASANLSGRHTFDGCGISAGWWASAQNWSEWPPQATPGTMFHSVFFAVKFDGKVLYEDKTLGQVISMTGAGDDNPSNLGMHLVAAYLNARQFPTQGGQPGYPYTVNQVVNGYNLLDEKPNEDFATFKATLETANNLYDSYTYKPTP